MAETRAPWTVEAVAARFEEAARTGRRLPPVRVQGYFNTWPQIVRQRWEVFCDDEPIPRLYPPCPEAVERMLQTMRWVLWLEVEQRHLIWMRANRHGWQHIGQRLACDRNTAARRWHKAVEVVVEQLNTCTGR